MSYYDTSAQPSSGIFVIIGLLVFVAPLLLFLNFIVQYLGFLHFLIIGVLSFLIHSFLIAKILDKIDKHIHHIRLNRTAL